MDKSMIVDTEPSQVIMGEMGECPVGQRGSNIPPNSFGEEEKKCPISYNKNGECRRCDEELYGTSGLTDTRSFTHCNKGWIVCGHCFYDAYCPDGRQLISLARECLACGKPIRTMKVEMYSYHAVFNCFQCGTKHVGSFDGLRIQQRSPEIPKAKIGEIKWLVVQ